ncbi:MAG: T9SS type A sorting domain-containing protein [bacterium]|nr:T9SS type A sorting domain-containing protein [bacterium]
MKMYCTLLFSALFFGASAQWTQKTNLPAPGRNHPVTFSINGIGYVTTGGNDGPPFYFDDMWKYDPVADSWSPLGNFPGGDRSFSYGVEHGGFGYAGFGAWDDGFNVTFFDDWYRFDPNSETWDTLTSCPCTARTHPAMVATTSKIYVGLGGSANGDIKDWWEYDIAGDSWTQRTDFPGTRRHHPYYFSIGDDVFVGFGHHQQQIFDDLYHYDIENDVWTQVASLPAEGRVAGTQFTYNGKGYILSGQGEDHLNLDTGEFWEYDPVNDSWTQLPPHPGSGRWAPGSFVIGDSIYLIGGQNNDIQPDQRDLWLLNFQDIVSVDELSQKSSLQVYPNPAQDHITIKSDAALVGIQIKNLLGELVLEADGFSSQVSVEHLPSGIYLLEVESEGQKISKRFVKE